MIRVLVIDDDRMARKGLIHTVPWTDYGMEVVGEASNGRTALDFLETTPVDLVLTDLEMPVVGGVELMKISTTRYPHLRFVIVSFHQEFSLVQETFRMGAIDYIAKSDLEREQIDKVIARIRDRFVSSTEAMQPGAAGPDLRLRSDTNEALVYVRTTSTEPFPEVLGEPLGQDMRLIPVTAEGSCKEYAGWKPLRLKGLLNEPFDKIKTILASYRQRGWYYDSGLSSVPVFDLKFLEKEETPEAPAMIDSFSTRLQAYEWIADDTVFLRLLEDLELSRLAPLRLQVLLSVAKELWARIYGYIQMDDLPFVESLRTWTEVKEWLGLFRRTIRTSLARPRFSPEVQSSIVNAIHLMHKNYYSPLISDEIARQVNMSRSYFCECFREITGKTFHDYLKTIRMQRARDLLTSGNMPIYRVGEMVGYADEKYFSRQFREVYQVLPSEYRRRQASG